MTSLRWPVLAALTALFFFGSYVHNFGITLFQAGVVLVVAADQLQTVLRYKGTSERVSLMFSAIMIVVLYLSPWPALAAAVLGITLANIIQWMVDRRPARQVVRDILTASASSVALVATFTTLNQWLTGDWPSVATAISLAIAGCAYESVNYVLRGIKHRRQTELYPLVSILIACTFGLVIEHHPLALVGLSILLLGALKPSYDLQKGSPT